MSSSPEYINFDLDHDHITTLSEYNHSSKNEEDELRDLDVQNLDQDEQNIQNNENENINQGNDPNKLNGLDSYNLIQYKKDLMEINNGWNDKNEKLILSIGENAASYKWMHEKSVEFYNMIQQTMGIILIIFSTGLSADTIVPYTTTENEAMSITRKIFTYIVTLISVLQNFLNYQNKIQNHSSAISSFSELYHDIQKQMCLYRKNRSSANVYVTTTLKQYDTLLINSPNIPSHIVNKFKKLFNNTTLEVPDIADKIQKIDIITEPSNDLNNLNDVNNLIKIQQNIPIGTNTNGMNSSETNAIGINTINQDTDTKTKNVTFYDTKTQKTKTTNKNLQKSNYKKPICNLTELHDACKIYGDITDEDLQQFNLYELKELRRNFLKEKQLFEYQRFMQHNTENEL